MSTVPEVIAARHAGLRVAAVSAVTNLAEGMGGEELSHDQTLRVAKEGAARLGPLIERFVEDLRVIPQELIRRKRDGGRLTDEEIAFIVGGIADGGLSDGQVAAFAMAVFFRDLDDARARRADRRDDALRHGARVGRRARSSTSTRPAASATRSRCSSPRSSPPAAARCR